MSRRFEQKREPLRNLLFEMGQCAEYILEKAIRSFLERDGALAATVEADDRPIDVLDVQIDEAVLEVLALQAPVATELREVIAIKMAANELERVGDLARNIAKGAMRVAGENPIGIPGALRDLAAAVRDSLRMALDAFGRKDAVLAQDVLDRDDAIDLAEDQLIQDALQIVRAHPAVAYQHVDVIVVAKHLERVADHATNIAEHTIFMKEARNVKHARKLS